MRAGATIVQRDPVLGNKSFIPDHTLIMIPAPTPEEANYLAALLNSSPATLVIQGYVSLHPSPHVLEHVAIPKFDPANPLHQSLASLSQRAHQLAARGKTAEAELRQVESEIDRLAAQLWGLTEEELAQVQRSLQEAG